jgi:serine O-acetyltransferase
MLNAIYFYRAAYFLHQKKIPLLPLFLKALTYILFNSVVPYTAVIGRGSKFAYGGIGVVVHGRAKIGSRVIIGQGTTIGRKLNPDGVPVIGDDVYISAGARILGDIKVGNNVIIGANSVVIHDVPDNVIVAGMPARIIRSVDCSIYDLLENVY